ncbi:MAG TPA: antitoxin Xre/MbcA/ParS toxin-binding domain-containing protein [Tepidisphaeraceae bacterium]|jgi:putative toxin-antitoxin system antitoxin component (TIGR02293 family)
MQHPRSVLAVVNLLKPGDSIGARYKNHLDAVKLIEDGLPFSSIARFQNTTGLTLERIKSIAHISEGSYSRRRANGRLSPEESERLLRVSRIFESAASLHDGDQRAAIQWLETPIPALSDQRPLDLARTDPGAREVEDLIGRIAHGVVS